MTNDRSPDYDNPSHRRNRHIILGGPPMTMIGLKISLAELDGLLIEIRDFLNGSSLGLSPEADEREYLLTRLNELLYR